MNRMLGVAFVALLAASAAIIVGTSSALPARVASHFAVDGRANGWQPLDSYRFAMLAFGVGAPALVAALIAWLPRRFPRFVNLRDKDYWLAPERRDATLAALAAFGYGVGLLTALLALGIHLAVVAANAIAPPRLGAGWFIALLAGFVAGIVALAVGQWRRFRAPR